MPNHQQLQFFWSMYKNHLKSNLIILGHENRQCNFPRGKVMGGSSVLNYLIYTRGHRKDYDAWVDAGNTGKLTCKIK